MGTESQQLQAVCVEDTVSQQVLSGAAFLHLILQHVLPKGFRRARNFGFLHPNSKRLLALLQVSASSV